MSDIERHDYNLEQQQEKLAAIKRRQAGELLASGIATRCFQEVSREMQLKVGGEPDIAVARTTSGSERENLCIALGHQTSPDNGRSIRELVAIRRGGMLVPDAMYEDLPYSLVADCCDELTDLIRNGTLPDVDERDFEMRRQ